MLQRRAGDDQDSPLSITSSVVTIVTLLFAVSVSVLVYIRPWKNAAENEEWIEITREMLENAEDVIRRIKEVQNDYYWSAHLDWQHEQEEGKGH